LDQTKELKAAKKALKGLAGVYAFINNITGAVYIGSSINIALRLAQHVDDNGTNAHLQNAITKYGLENFTFVVVEVFKRDPSVSMETNKARLLAMEQVYLTWGSSLPKDLFYNFLHIAGSSLGYKHTEDTRAQMSDSKSGANNPMSGKTHSPESRAQMSDSQQLVDRSGANNSMYGKVPANYFQGGPNNPMFGKVAANAMTVNVYSLDNVLVRSFTSQVDAANWVNIPRSTFQVYLNSGKVWNHTYFFRKSCS
jgi:group I intron endonuclease